MWKELFEVPAIWFSIPALVGTGLFLARLGLMFLGGHHDLDVDPTIPDVHPGDHHNLDPHEGSSVFKAISFQAIIAFAMGFGWAGLGALKGANSSPLVAVFVGSLGGLFLAVVLTFLLRSVRKLESSGNIALSKAIGSEGDVYATVPASGQGRGQVTLVLDGRQRTYNATTSGRAIPTAARVKVVRVAGDNSVIVEPV